VLPWTVLAFALTAQPPAKAAEPPIQITLRRTTCFGECPDYTVSIDGHGNVTYEGRRFVRVTGKQVARIDRAAVQALLDEFERIEFFSLKDKYTARITDLPTTYVTLVLGDRSKTVEDYHGAPKALRDLERHIDEAAGVQRWIRIDAATVKEMSRGGWRAGGDEGLELLRQALTHDEVDVVSALIDAGVNVNGDDASGTTPLMMARSAEVARLLIAAGANVQMPNVNGVGALQMSIWREPELTRVLLRAGAVADDPSHQSPLFLAACAGNADAVQVLLQAGAVPDRYDVHSGKTPRQCAESASQVRDPEPLFENVKPPFEKNFARVIALLDRATAKRK
jgi:Domain of unknown function (DUF6438)/Ankyrin repeat